MVVSESVLSPRRLRDELSGKYTFVGGRSDLDLNVTFASRRMWKFIGLKFPQSACIYSMFVCRARAALYP